uniref:Uncharacterized protein n=1 Tax=viral metagenome TaxID=1070528 RepID=A0A6C0EBJ0_9ZZZZ
MAEDTSIYRSICDSIESSEQHMRIIYVAIGSKANFDESTSADFNQQYPTTLYKFKRDHSDANIHLILIDPELEDPPKCTPMITNEKVYCVRKNIEHHEILELISNLIVISIKDNSLFIIDAFIGLHMDSIARQFDDAIKEHLDHIIIGMGCRDKHGCFPKLNDRIYHFVYSINNNRVKVFNPYYNLINRIPFEESTNSLIEHQKLFVLEHLIHNIKIDDLAELRKVVIDNGIPSFDTLRSKLSDIISVWNLPTNAELIISKIMSQPDIYKWTNIINEILNIDKSNNK